MAYRIMKRILSSTMTTVPKSAVLLYDELKTIIKAKSEKDGLFITDIWVTQREIREVSGLTHDLVKRNIRLLAEYEYIKVKGSGRGMTRRYGLAADSDLVLFDESVIPSPEKLGAGRKQASCSPMQPGNWGLTGAQIRKASKSLPCNPLEESGVTGVIRIK